MAFMTVRLVPGTHVEQTPLLLQAGIIQSNNIRWREGLPEKMGGWKKFYYTPEEASQVIVDPQPGPIRELWTWSDFNAIRYLAAGGDQGLSILTLLFPDITPRYNIISNTAYRFTTTAGSPVVTVYNVDSDVTANNVGSIVFDNYVAIDGLILYGAYPITLVPLNDTAVTIVAASNAATGVTNAAGVVSTFTTDTSSNICTVILPAHGFSPGKAVFFLPTTLTGSSSPPASDVVIHGAYSVLNVVDANTFTIGLNVTAENIVGPISENGGNIEVRTWLVEQPPFPPGAYGAGAYGAFSYGGSGVTGSTAPLSGTAVTANNLGVNELDWSLVNFGEALIAQPEGHGFFKWAPDGGYQMAQPIPEAPLAATGFFLAMPQQQLVAYGASTGASQPKIRCWCAGATMPTIPTGRRR